MKDEIKEILDKLKNGFCSALTYEKLLDYITNLEQKVDRLLKTQKMYERMCNKINDYIVQNCEIIRHKDYDEVGKVNGGHILTLLASGDEK